MVGMRACIWVRGVWVRGLEIKIIKLQYHTTFCNTIPQGKLIKTVVNTTSIPVNVQHCV